MKKRILTLLTFTAFLLAGFLPASASAVTPGHTDITGKIIKAGVGVLGATVQATCNGHTGTDTSNAFGDYLIDFMIADCPVGAVVNVMATKGSESGSATGTVSGVTTKLNVALVNVTIPEFGWIAGLSAGGLGAGAIFITRRRSAQRV